MVSLLKLRKEKNIINIEDKYISKRVVWTSESRIQDHYRHKTSQNRNNQENARLEFIARVSAGEFKFELRKCIICGGTDFYKIADCDRMGLYFPTSVCCGCGFVQANPVLRQSDYDDFYRVLYRNMFTGRRKLTEDVFRNKANTRGARLFSYLENTKVLKQIDKEKDLIVEVGCGDGSILSYFHDQGYRIVGIDFDEDYMSLARNLGYNLRCAGLKDVVAEQKPKLVYYNHVLEHIVDADSHLLELSKCVNEAGFVAVVVPGVKHIHKAYRGDLLHYLQVAHVLNFSLYTLELLMANYGFRMQTGDERIRAIFKMDENCHRITPGRSESLSIIHYFKTLELEMQKRGNNNWFFDVLSGNGSP